RRHTRFSRDWSSDVCSSDLPRGQELVPPPSPLGKLPEPVAALLRSGETIHLTTPLEEHAELAPGQAEGDGLYRLLLAPGVYAWRDRKSVVEGSGVAAGGRRP